ncbi:MAG: hypothetical protein QXE76_01130 [Candidatus Bathyarchaeia archaeon]
MSIMEKLMECNLKTKGTNNMEISRNREEDDWYWLLESEEEEDEDKDNNEEALSEMLD